LSFNESAAVDALPADRIEHLNTCSYCKALVQVIKPSDKVVEAFSHVIEDGIRIKRSTKPSSRSPRAGVPLLIGVLALAVGFAAGRLGRNEATQWSFQQAGGQTRPETFTVIPAQDFSYTLASMNEPLKMRMIRQLGDFGRGTVFAEASLKRVVAEGSGKTRQEAQRALARIRALEGSESMDSVLAPASVALSSKDKSSDESTKARLKN
jgi:hypothetical protein